jgi:hypothetical protein
MAKLSSLGAHYAAEHVPQDHYSCVPQKGGKYPCLLAAMHAVPLLSKQLGVIVLADVRLLLQFPAGWQWYSGQGGSASPAAVRRALHCRNLYDSTGRAQEQSSSSSSGLMTGSSTTAAAAAGAQSPTPSVPQQWQPVPLIVNSNSSGLLCLHKLTAPTW